jgi:hypothetical protein
MTHPLGNQPFKQHRLWPLIRSALVFCGTALAVSVIGGCTPSAPIAAKEVELIDQTVELACGECQFKLPGPRCNLAIRVNGKAERSAKAAAARAKLDAASPLFAA